MPDPIELDRLTAHHERIRRLARALVRSEQEAEDLVQDAWVRALERGPRDSGALGAWLATVVRRLAGNGRRSDRRRLFREQESARPEAVPSSADIAARVDVETRLAAALESLPEPHRTLLRDRYLGGLDAPAIAERDGRTPDSVHSSLKRARAALRQHLERKGFGEDVHWTAALAPFIVPTSGGGADLTTLTDPSIHAAAKTTSLLVGTLAMKKALAVLLVVTLGAVTWWGAADFSAVKAEPAEDRTVGVATFEVALSAAENDLTGDEAEALAAPPEAFARSAGLTTSPATGWQVQGQFRTADGGGLPGVPFQVSMYAGMQPGGSPLQRFDLVSDPNGRFVLDAEDPGQSVCFTVDVEDEPRAFFATQDVYRAPLGGAPPLIEIVAFERDATVTGIVLDTNDRPVAGAHVDGKGGRTTTEGDGSFELDISSQSFGRLRAWADGHGLAEAFIEDMAAGDALEVVLRLPPEFIVSGTVRDQQGAPIAGAEITISGEARDTTRTDAAGRYRVASLAFPPGGALRVSARHDVHASESRQMNVPPDTAEVDVDFELTRGIEIQGVVLAPDGTPVAGAEVWTGFDPHAWDRVIVYSDDAGKFRLDGATEARTHVGASARDWPTIDRLMELSAGCHVTLQFERSRALRGIVQDPSGAPLSGIGVSAKRDGSYFDSDASTDAQGRFELTGFGSEGRFGVDVFGSGWIRSEVDVPQSALDREASNFVVTLSEAGVLSGNATDAATGQPLTGFTVRIGWPEWLDGIPDGAQPIQGVDASWYQHGKVFNDEDGHWSTTPFDEFPPGHWAMVEVSAPGYAPLRVDAVEIAPVDEPSDQMYALLRPVTARVSVTSGDEPLGDARVLGSTAKEPRPADATWRATTGAAGVALLEELPPGLLFLRVESEGRADWNAGPFEISAAGSTISVELPPGYPLGVTLRNAEGEPLPGERIMLTGMNAGGSTKTRTFATTDASGRARFPLVTPGIWRIARAVGGGEFPLPDLPLDVTVHGNQGEMSVVLQPEGIAHVTVTFEGPEPPPNEATLYLNIEGGRGRAALLREGRAEFAGVMPGAYRISGFFWDAAAGKAMRLGGAFEVESGVEDVEVQATLDE
ncbi:RNA polymerase sigma factor [Planctomycetes bacterium Poly30]|uniref:RNA polymerase sigma factor n=1 Tax=Saltatorellus ferox TaxID=2528018 RepID=A0A518EVT7_9BACT|nr:RNA polymerase sigma factor [Planctomycetes bacterium Poly30]